MRRSHEEHEGSHENSERWLLTYSDVITLLLALFIILYGMSAVDYKKMSAVSEGFQRSLHNDKKKQEEQPQENNAAEPEPVILPVDSGLGEAFEALRDMFKNQNENKVDLTLTNDYLLVTLKENALFFPDSATMIQGEIIIQSIADILSQIYPAVNHITISGHTADTGRHDTQTESNSWRLSVERALAVLNALTKMGLNPEKMSIEGRSHYNPATTNETEEGRAKNRRVVLTII
ncbi:MAG: flagellar motor protein MotB [Oscillospiraceae bacterium]|jgi:chemotaxis protein MotB|nr:flagellar motor protein MotB [Oscillospiraceae bacterium]